jgi:hypothetical protein
MGVRAFPVWVSQSRMRIRLETMRVATPKVHERRNKMGRIKKARNVLGAEWKFFSFEKILYPYPL